jgi:hypothetical protein
VFTARYALSPYINQIRFLFKGLNCNSGVVVTAAQCARKCCSAYGEVWVRVQLCLWSGHAAVAEEGGCCFNRNVLGVRAERKSVISGGEMRRWTRYIPIRKWIVWIPVVTLASCRFAYQISVCSLPDCSLDVSMHPEGPATGRLDAGMLVFLCLHANAGMLVFLCLHTNAGMLVFLCLHANAGMLVFLCLHANAGMVPKFQAATACCCCSPPGLGLSLHMSRPCRPRRQAHRTVFWWQQGSFPVTWIKGSLSTVLLALCR